jgi:hypothetical protein
MKIKSRDELINSDKDTILIKQQIDKDNDSLQFENRSLLIEQV